jgi:hypothetical protein
MPSPVMAQATGNNLLNDCEQFLKEVKLEGDQVYTPNTLESGRCWGLMSAASGFMFLYEPEKKTSMLHTCIPPNAVPVTQLIRIVVSYGEQHPEELHHMSIV